MSSHSEQPPHRAGTAVNSAAEQCPLCDASFADAALLVSHVEYAHSDIAGGANGNGNANGNGSGNASQGLGSSCSIS